MVLLLIENEKNTDILFRFGQADLPNESMNWELHVFGDERGIRAGLLMSLIDLVDDR